MFPAVFHLYSCFIALAFLLTNACEQASLNKCLKHELLPLSCSFASEQGGEVPICCVLVPLTVIKTQDVSQEEILLVVNSQNHFIAMIVNSQN